MRLGTTTLSVTQPGRRRRRAVAAGGGAPVYDLAYDGFFSQNKAPLDFSNGSYNNYNHATLTHETLDTFIDHNTGRLYGGYNTAHYYQWANAGLTYSGNADFYTVGTRSNFAGHGTSYMGSTGRGLTIAYLGDQTPVIVISRNSNRRMDFYSYPGTNHLGYMLVPSGTNYPGSSNDMSGLAFDGTNLLMVNRAQSFMWAFSMPANTSGISGNLTSVKRWSMPYPVQYGMAWTGDGVIMGKIYDTSSVAYIRITDNGFNGTSTEIRSYAMPSTNYSLAIDYKNRKLLVGGYSNDRYRVYTE